jgi:hypothetical protein
MKLKHLVEMPIPAEWDKEKFSSNNSYSKMIAYANEKAQKLGSGSSRVAFIVPFEGRQTVLKVAKNGKGLAQNEHEAQMFSDWYLKGLGVTIPMIDYDEENEPPRWIHTEMATKAKEADFKKATGLGLRDLFRYVAYASGRHNVPYRMTPQEGQPWIEKLEDNEFASSLVDLVGNYDLPIGDFERIANWGIFDGRLVIIDLGLNNDIFQKLYSGKSKEPRW